MKIGVIIAVALILILIIVLITWRMVYLFDNREKIRKMLGKVIQVLNKHNVEYWIDYGSLLGITVQKDIILGDNYGDVSILNTPENKAKYDLAMAELGATYYDWGAYRIFDGNVYIDIYIADLSNGKISVEGDIRDSKYILPPVKVNLDIGSYSIDGYVPADITGTLEQTYGKNWRNLKRNWYTLYY